MRLLALAELERQARKEDSKCPAIMECDRSRCNKCAVDQFHKARYHLFSLIANLLDTVTKLLLKMEPEMDDDSEMKVGLN